MTDLNAAALRALAFGLIQDRIAAADKTNRQELLAGMEVTDRKAVRLPLNGQPVTVGSVTHAKGSVTASVSDEAALLEWVQANHPDAVRVETVVTVAPWLRDELLATAKRDGVAHDHNGETVPGITVRETASKVMVVRDKSLEAQAALIAAIFADGVEGVRSLLAIEPPEVTE